MSFSPSGGDEYADDALPVTTPVVQTFMRRLARADTAEGMLAELDRLVADAPDALSASLPRRDPQPRPGIRSGPETA